MCLSDPHWLYGKDLRWQHAGLAHISGDLLRLKCGLDAYFSAIAVQLDCVEHEFSPFIGTDALQKMDYLHSFPTHVTFASILEKTDQNVHDFIHGEMINQAGEIVLSKTMPIKNILTPAVCYHFYQHYSGEDLSTPLYLTSRCNCYRSEAEYQPLQRQWSFAMRELVVIGADDEVMAFVERAKEMLMQMLATMQLAVYWDTATDPFFDPSNNPKYLMQQIQPNKYELLFEENLALASINLHRNYFGESFGITRHGQSATSACIAFGLERWMYSILQVYGAEPRAWPECLQPFINSPAPKLEIG